MFCADSKARLGGWTWEDLGFRRFSSALLPIVCAINCKGVDIAFDSLIIYPFGVAVLIDLCKWTLQTQSNAGQ